MTHKKPQKNIISKILSIFLISGFLLPSLVPYPAIAQTALSRENYFGIDSPDLNVVDINNMQTLNPATSTGVEEEGDIKIKSINTVKSLKNEKIVTIKKISGKSAKDASTNTLIVENIINYLMNQQNIDGSWGNNAKTKFITTVATLEALQANSVTGEKIDKGIEWLSYYIPENNDYRAEQSKVLTQAGEENTENAQTLTYGIDENTGGFRFDNSYKADPLTTAKTIQALYAANYTDSGTESNLTQSLALHYLINTKRFDNGWSVFESGVSTIPVSSEAIEALLLWRHRELGAIKIDDTLDPAVNSLVNTQMQNGAWGNDILNTALAYHALKASGATPIYENETLQYFKNEQKINGSFNNDIYKTAKVLKALSVYTDSGQIVIDDFSPKNAPQTGALAEFNLSISNTGKTPVANGKIHIMTDDFLFKSFDFASNNIVVNANSTLNITIEIRNTRGFQGDVAFKIFIEDQKGFIYPNSRYEKIITFTADPENRPALPLYYVAYKSVTNNDPTITWSWPAKSDPYLDKYVLMFRELGATTWSGVYVNYPNTNAIVGPFTPDQIYETTIGTSDVAGNIYYFNSDFSQVKTSASPSAYTTGTVSGKVKAIEGEVEGVYILGVNTATNTISAPPTIDNGSTAGGASTGIIYNENGEYTQRNAPWGSGYVRVSDSRYENFISKYTNANTDLTNIDVFTNLKTNTQNPTVGDIFTPVAPSTPVPIAQNNETTEETISNSTTQNDTTAPPKTIPIPITQDNGTTAGIIPE
jgi:hypothetical protein